MFNRLVTFNKDIRYIMNTKKRFKIKIAVDVDVEIRAET